MNEEPPERVAHIGVIVLVTFIILIAFAAVTGWVLIYSEDQTTRGAIVQTWNNLAIAAGTFWLGSSLGGKMKK
jgi:SNF family Na+-dependent transporter